MINNKIEEKKEITTNNNKSEIDLKELVFDMIKELPERAKDIITKRFNLDSKGIRTLDEIGKEYDITRERVRQIEAESISRLKEIGVKYGILKALEHIKQIVVDHGGIISEDKIVDLLFAEKNNISLNRQIALLILSLDNMVKKAKETKAYKKIYFYEQESVVKLKEVTEKMEKYFQENRQPISFDKLVEMVNSNISNILSSKTIKSYMDANKIVLGNILGEWGHEKWPNISPKSARDKAYLALKQSGKPLHFVDIANKINDIWRGKKRANSQTVHNELIKDNRFVLIGRGVYALKEWGYSPGTVLDVIIETMKAGKNEMGQEEIVQEVLKKRQVKRNTIVLNLQNKEYFEKLPNKVYKLKSPQKW